MLISFFPSRIVCIAVFQRLAGDRNEDCHQQKYCENNGMLFFYEIVKGLINAVL